MRVAVIGGGPAGMRAAEVLSGHRVSVDLFDQKPSVGRKFLVAGRGGLNLTHSEPLPQFKTRYSNIPESWNAWLDHFSPSDLQAWAKSLGIPTYIGTSGRVFPESHQAAPLLRRWVHQLKQQGVTFHMNHRWVQLEPGRPVRLKFQCGAEIREPAFDAAIFALGGGSWPQTGSDGRWVVPWAEAGIRVNPLQPANCGFEVDWPESVLNEAEGQPIKNVTASAGGRQISGELMVTRYGLEGGIMYQLGRELRAMKPAVLTLDLKPTFSVEQLVAKAEAWRGKSILNRAIRSWKLGKAAAALLAAYSQASDLRQLAATAKTLSISLKGPRPLEEAISSAGGVDWSEIDEDLMIRRWPGVFMAGEMLDWEAPTGGYLLQGCFATGTAAAQGCLKWIR